MPHNLSGADIANLKLRSIPPYVVREYFQPSHDLAFLSDVDQLFAIVAALVWVIHDYCENGGFV